jgi:hypothetical protein
MKEKDRGTLMAALALAERKLIFIQSLIDRGHLSRLTLTRLNTVYRKIEKLDAALKEACRELKGK